MYIRKQISVIILFFMMVFITSHGFAQFTIKAGVDMLGTHNVSADQIPIDATTFESLDESKDVKSGISLAFELAVPASQWINFGFGLEYQTPRALTKTEGDFSFLSIYPLIKIPFNNFYVMGRGGFNLINADVTYKSIDYEGINYTSSADEQGIQLKDRFHYGFGAGIVRNKRLFLEILYSVNTANRKFTQTLCDLRPVGFGDSECELFDTDFITSYSKISISIGYKLGEVF